MSHKDSLIVIEGINNVIKNSGIDTNKISDGYHSFGELYEHRIELFIQLCKWCYTLGQWHDDISPFLVYDKYEVWRSKKHHDGTEYEGWFIMGIGKEKGKQVSYHLPVSKWDDCSEITILELAPEWDGHTSNDVIERLKNL